MKFFLQCHQIYKFLILFGLVEFLNNFVWICVLLFASGIFYGVLNLFEEKSILEVDLMQAIFLKIKWRI